MNHIEAVIARRIKFILEKQAFISFAFDTHKGRYRKLKKSIFPSKTGNKNQILEINKFLVDYFSNVVKNVLEICESDPRSARLRYDEYFREIIRELHRKLEDSGLCNKFNEDTPIFWAYFTKMVNIIIYDLITHNELVETSKFHKIKWFIHAPIDNKIISELRRRIPSLEDLRKMNEIKKMLKFCKRLDSIDSEESYDQIQRAIRIVQDMRDEPPIYIEDAYSLT